MKNQVIYIVEQIAGRGEVHTYLGRTNRMEFLEFVAIFTRGDEEEMEEISEKNPRLADFSGD